MIPLYLAVLFFELQPHAVAGAIYSLLRAAVSPSSALSLFLAVRTLPGMFRDPGEAKGSLKVVVLAGASGVLDPRRGQTHAFVTTHRDMHQNVT